MDLRMVSGIKQPGPGTLFLCKIPDLVIIVNIVIVVSFKYSSGFILSIVWRPWTRRTAWTRYVFQLFFYTRKTIIWYLPHIEKTQPH